jgi:hypothetical protein
MWLLLIGYQGIIIDLKKNRIGSAQWWCHQESKGC